MAYPYEQANSYDAATGKNNVEQKNTPAYLSAAGATQLTTGAGYLDLYSGTQGTGAINIYDLVGTTASLANQIGAIPALPLTINGATTNTQAPVTVNFHAQYNNGLYVNIISSATVAAGTLSHS